MNRARSSVLEKSVALGFACFFFYQIVIEKKEWIFIDYINLAYHEAGHLFLSFGSETLQFMGGTLGQLLFPFGIGAVFFCRKEYFSALIMLFWFFENGQNIARYMADAISMELPLVGGGIHDWNWLFTQWNCLNHCELYAQKVLLIGNMGMMLSLLGAAYFFFVSLQSTTESE